jgi:hypothetical protein
VSWGQAVTENAAIAACSDAMRDLNGWDNRSL